MVTSGNAVISPRSGIIISSRPGHTSKYAAVCCFKEMSHAWGHVSDRFKNVLSRWSLWHSGIFLTYNTFTWYTLYSALQKSSANIRFFILQILRKSWECAWTQKTSMTTLKGNTIKHPHIRKPSVKWQVPVIIHASQGFWQLNLDESSTEYCTFNTSFGRYCFLGLPFEYSQHL